MLTPDPILGAGYHDGECEQILLGPLPCVPGCHPGGPTVPLIFNVVLYMIIHSLVGMVSYNKAGPDGFGYMVAEKAEIF